jgi:hypothetical protein
MVELASTLPELTSPPLEPPETLFDVTYPDKDLPIYHGEVFRCLRASAMDERGGWGRIVASELQDFVGAHRSSEMLLAAVVLDACFFACGIFVWIQDQQAVAIPRGMRRILIGRHPTAGEECLLRIERRSEKHHQGVFDFTLVGQDRTVILRVEGYQVIIVPRGAQ